MTAGTGLPDGTARHGGEIRALPRNPTTAALRFRAPPRTATSIGNLHELRFAAAGGDLGLAGSYRSVLRYTASACTSKSDKVLKIGGM